MVVDSFVKSLPFHGDYPPAITWEIADKPNDFTFVKFRYRFIPIYIHSNIGSFLVRQSNSFFNFYLLMQ